MPPYCKTTKILTRSDWKAKDPLESPKKLQALPPPYVIIAETSKNYCTETTWCRRAVREEQELALKKHHGDIDYNFLVAPEGSVFEGRGWDVEGFHTYQYNDKSLGIAFIGDYWTYEPTDEQMYAALALLEFAVCQKKVTWNYKLLSQNQTMLIESPGTVEKPVNCKDLKAPEILTRDWSGWRGQQPASPPKKLRTLPAPYVIITETSKLLCIHKMTCMISVYRDQELAFRKGHSDIDHNFLIGGEGTIFEGRGWDIEGEHTFNYNHTSIDIAFMGNFWLDEPSEKQLNAALTLLDIGVCQKKLASNYKLLSQRQLMHGERPGTTVPPEPAADCEDLKILTRDADGWRGEGRLNPQSAKKFQAPPPYVIITETSREFCTELSKCKSGVFSEQQLAFRKMHQDIDYNFLIGGEGTIFEGRGWDLEGEHTPDYNQTSLGVAFMGNFSSVDPSEGQLNSALALLKLGVCKKKLQTNYKLLGQKQVMRVDRPGVNLYSLIRDWEHWVPTLGEETTVPGPSQDICTNPETITRAEWEADAPSRPPKKLEVLPVSYVIIGHTRMGFCKSKDFCILSVQQSQKLALKRLLSDIEFNFLVGGDGLVYEGRGWDVQGEHTFGYNQKSLGIALIGDFWMKDPTTKQLDAAKALIEFAVCRNKLGVDYKLLGQNSALNAIIKTWEHWSPDEKLNIT